MEILNTKGILDVEVIIIHIDHHIEEIPIEIFQEADFRVVDSQEAEALLVEEEAQEDFNYSTNI